MQADSSPAPAPTVLLLTSCRWQFAARLGIALSSAGCSVDACCPSGHPVTYIRGLRDRYAYRALAPRRSLLKAIQHSAPDLVIPCDDLATGHLHSLYRATFSPEIRALIIRSLGDPASFPAAASRSALMQVAQQHGVATPATSRVASHADLRSWLSVHGFPAFLKADGSSGGTGVRLIRSFEEADRAFSALSSFPSLLRTAKRTFVDRDPTLILTLLSRARPSLTVQRHISGRDANSISFCSQGEVLATIAVEVLRTRYATGPSTVVRVIEDTEVNRVARTVAAALGLSGFFGLDFILEERTGTPHLIEMNPRVTQITHLALGPGRDIPAAAFASLSGEPLRPRPRVTDEPTIALFPQEWQKDPGSSYLRTAYHDVPWEEPDLLRQALRNKPEWQQWLSSERWTAARARVRPQAVDTTGSKPAQSS